MDREFDMESIGVPDIQEDEDVEVIRIPVPPSSIGTTSKAVDTPKDYSPFIIVNKPHRNHYHNIPPTTNNNNSKQSHTVLSHLPNNSIYSSFKPSGTSTQQQQQQQYQQQSTSDEQITIIDSSEVSILHELGSGTHGVIAKINPLDYLYPMFISEIYISVWYL